MDLQGVQKSECVVSKRSWPWLGCLSAELGSIGDALWGGEVNRDVERWWVRGTMKLQSQ